MCNFFFPNSPFSYLGLNQDSVFHLAGVSRLFIFAERTLTYPQQVLEVLGCTLFIWWIAPYT